MTKKPHSFHSKGIGKCLIIMRLTFYLLMCSVIHATAGVQQASVIKGIVKDQFGETLPGVTIMVKGTSNGTASDIDGNFELKLSDSKGAVLVFTYIGMNKQEVAVPANGQLMNVVMQGNQAMLEEVVVTGYGTMKKSTYNGSASVIKTEKLQDVPVTSVNDLLLGNASGVTVNGGSNQPGAPSSIRIRGVGSFNASQSPLYVVDGVPVMSGDISSVSSSSTVGMDVMSTISTSDIESITVVKDAAAASLYGSRAANGVILITTKSGKKGKAVFNAKADYGFSDFAMDYRKVMNGQDRRNLIMEGLYNRGMEKYKNDATQAQAYVDSNIDKYAPVPWCGFVDWNDVLFQKGSYKNYDVSANGGTDNMRYYSSLNYTDQEGVTLNSGLQRLTGRVNVDWNATKKITLGVKALFSDIHQDVFSEGSNYTSPFYSSRNAVVPSDPVYLEDGSYNRSFIRNSDRNPKLAMDYNFKNQALTRAFNTLYGQYEIMKDLKFKTTFSYDYNLSKGDTWSDPRTSDGKSSNGSRSKEMKEYRKWVWSNTLGYDTRIGENHNIDALVAFDAENYTSDFLSGNTKNFADPDLNEIENGATPTSVGGYNSAWRMASLISRFNYNYAGKYYLGGSYRYDGTSRLSRQDNNRWGSFWSVSGSWRLSEEKFLAESKGTISDLRLRASYGTNGTQPTGYYGYYSLSSLGAPYMGNPGIIDYQIENKLLKWENNYNFNLGVDMGLFGRVNFTAEVYNRLTKNLLMDFPISKTTGFSSYLRNVGEVRNKGIEFEVNSVNVDTKDFKWTTNFNIGHNKNEIVKWDGLVTESVGSYSIKKVGLPYSSYYVIEFAGINPANGNPQFFLNTPNADGSVNRDITENPNEAQKIPYKGFDPNVSGGLTNAFSYKWFDLNFLITYCYGGYSYDNGAQKSEHGGLDLQANIPEYYKDRWQKPGDVTNIERFIQDPTYSMQNITNSRRIHSTDFVRLKNLTFGISAPKTWTKKAGIEKLRIYCSGNNLLTWSKWGGYDPESVGSTGVVEWEQPPLKTWTFGVDVRF